MTASLAVGTASAAVAADRCLSRAEQRARAAAHAVVPLSRAMRAVHKRGEVIHARLCEHSGHLVYLLTVLEGDGKVALASVDAASGMPVGAHAYDRKDKAAKVVKDKDVKDKDAKDKDAKDKDAKDKDAKDKDARDRSSKDRDVKDKDVKDKDTKDQDVEKAPK
ncbi:MAG TPA: hypothetical protein VGG01_17275 [Xanthobacteraceae bacterium]